MSTAAAHGAISQPQARALARNRRTELRRRARRIRRSVAALALAIFSAAFLAIYIQLASGHDPALAAAARRPASVSAQTSNAASTTSAGEATGTESSESGAVSAVTTSQS
jgi:hypothetical protein